MPMMDILTYQILYYNNSVDHVFPFSPTTTGATATFPHRYLLNDTFFGSPKATSGDGVESSIFLDFIQQDDSNVRGCCCPGPIFMYTGNEGSIIDFWGGNGFMQYLTVKYGGLLLFPEERYYGESMPTHVDDLVTNPHLLTTQQVLEDYVELLAHVKKQYNAETCPTIAFGGSYGGTLAAYLRLTYPFAIQGSLAASSELGYYDTDGWAARGITQYTFSNIMASQYYKTDGCLEAIWDASDLMDTMAASADPAVIDTLLKEFHFCDVSALSPTGSATFIYGLEGLPQQNYPYAIGHLPAWPVQAACQVLTNNSLALLERAAIVTAMSLGYDLGDGEECFSTLEEGPGNIPGDGPGVGSWGFQSCTETIHEFSSVSRDYDNLGLRNFHYQDEVANLTAICKSLYNTIPRTDVLADRYGGFDIATVTTNTIFSSGLLDPWGGGAITARDGGRDAAHRGVYFFTIPNGAHHLDLKGWNEADPDDVRLVRQQEEEIIVGWIRQWGATKGSEAGANVDTSSSRRVQEHPGSAAVSSFTNDIVIVWPFVTVVLLWAMPSR